MPRLIYADPLKQIYNGNGTFTEAHFRTAIDEQPTVDAVEVVRCEECKYSHPYRLLLYRCDRMGIVFKDEYCSKGERREDDGND